jgi:hypothetical protein
LLTLREKNIRDQNVRDYPSAVQRGKRRALTGSDPHSNDDFIVQIDAASPVVCWGSW